TSPTVNLPPASDVADALGTFFLTLAEIAPVVLLVDDAHAADPQSLPLFLAIGRAARRRRLLLVVAAESAGSPRTEAALAMLRRGSARIRLRPFNAAQTEDFVRSSFGEAP